MDIGIGQNRVPGHAGVQVIVIGGYEVHGALAWPENGRARRAAWGRFLWGGLPAGTRCGGCGSAPRSSIRFALGIDERSGRAGRGDLREEVVLRDGETFDAAEDGPAAGGGSAHRCLRADVIESQDQGGLAFFKQGQNLGLFFGIHLQSPSGFLCDLIFCGLVAWQSRQCVQGRGGRT